MNDQADSLRSPDNACDPDTRIADAAKLEPGQFGARALHDHHAMVFDIQLHNAVPNKIRVQFETTKNLYLYSWFVFRFYPVTRSHAYGCLELALREVFGDALYAADELARREKHDQRMRANPSCRQKFMPRAREDFRPTLRPLLKFAIECGALSNNQFEVWRTKTRVRARSRASIERIEYMQEHGLDQLEFDDESLEITDEDRDHDHLAVLLERIPYIRNHYAHGSTALDCTVLGTLRTVSEIINQIYLKKSTVPG